MDIRDLIEQLPVSDQFCPRQYDYDNSYQQASISFNLLEDVLGIMKESNVSHEDVLDGITDRDTLTLEEMVTLAMSVDMKIKITLEPLG